MKAISIRSPWWWFILHAGKDIENRDWRTSYRVPVLIHASKWWRQREVLVDFTDACDMACHAPGFEEPPVGTFAEIQRLGGHIVGRADIVDCVARSDSPWFVGQFGLVRRNVRAFPTPWAATGALGLFATPWDDSQ